MTVAAVVLALTGCGEPVADVEHGNIVSRRPHTAASNVVKVRFYKAMGATFHQAAREAGNAKAKDLFTGQRKGWDGFGDLAAGQGGSYTLPGYSWQAMTDALGSLPVETCMEVASQIADAYGDLHKALKQGSRPGQEVAAKGARDWRDVWLWRNRHDC